MRIADITEFYSPMGGVRNHLNTKGRALRDLGHQHMVVAPGKMDCERPLDPLAPGNTDAAVRIMEIGGPTLPYDPDYQWLYRLGRVHDALKRFQPDVITIHSLYMAALAVQTLPREVSALRTIWWHADFVDTYIAPWLSQWIPDRAREFVVKSLWTTIRKIANLFAATFVASKVQAAKLSSRGIERVTCIPFGVDRGTFRPEARDPERRTELLGPEPDAALIIAVGRLSAEKNWETVVNAVGALRGHHKVRLVLFGDGPEAERLRRLADPNAVIFMGAELNRERLAQAIASSDLLVHGGMNETYCLSVCEAIASGIPVVVPNSGAVIELTEPGFAELFDPNSAAACASAMARVLGAEFPRYRTCALNAAQNVPDSTGQVLRVVNEYASLIAERQQSCQATEPMA
jgi:alpha-1,6-mannosyltransferase